MRKKPEQVEDRMEGMVQQQAENISDTSKEVLESVKEAGAEVQEGLRATVHEVIDAVRREGSGFVDEQKHRLSVECENFGNLLKDTGQRLRDQRFPNAASYAEAAAQQLGSAAHYINETPVGRMVDDLEEGMRARPELFLGGMLLIGLAAARFFRASAPPSTPYGYYEH